MIEDVFSEGSRDQPRERLEPAALEPDGPGAPPADLEDAYRSCFAHAGFSLFAIAVTADGEFLVEDTNLAHERLTGLDADALRGRAPHAFLPRECADCVVANYRRCLALGRTISYEETLDLPTGTSTWETVLTPVRDASGRIARLVGSARDVTRERQADEEIERGRRLLRRIVDASPDIIYVYDLATSRNVFISRRVEDVLGLSREQVRSLGDQVLSRLIHPSDLSRVQDHVAALCALGVGEVAEIEYRMQAGDGSWRWVASKEVVFARGPDGSVQSVLGVASDVTSRRASQEQIRELDERLAALQNEERRRIATDLHDSTAQLLVGASLLASRLNQVVGDGPEAGGLARELKGLVEQAQKEIRISAYLLHPPNLESEGLVSALRTYVSGFAQRTGIEAATTYTGDGDFIPSDLRTALLRITQEALANVHRHASAKRVEVALEVAPAALSLRITDDGRGMPPHGGSIGLGMAGMRARIERFGGALRVTSDPSGTTVEATAPIAVEAP
jgi:PAS domain S-box-containing protein